jgi:hypothetical protein
MEVSRMLFDLEVTSNDEVILKVSLPEELTQGELINLTKDELDYLKENFYGKHIRINGRLTTGMALTMGHRLAHVCQSVAIFDPKLNTYYTCIKH